MPSEVSPLDQKVQ